MRAHRLKEQRAIDIINPDVGECGETAIRRYGDDLVFHVWRAKDFPIGIGIPLACEAVIVHISQPLRVVRRRLAESGNRPAIRRLENR